jgi:hypothetical protein
MQTPDNKRKNDAEDYVETWDAGIQLIRQNRERIRPKLFSSDHKKNLNEIFEEDAKFAHEQHVFEMEWLKIVKTDVSLVENHFDDIQGQLYCVKSMNKYNILVKIEFKFLAKANLRRRSQA